MRHIFKVLVILFIAFGCSNENHQNRKFEISIYESHSLTDLIPKIFLADSIIWRYQIDSNANQKSGIELLDQINKLENQNKKIEKNSIDDYPLFKILHPNATHKENGIMSFDTSSIIGSVSDTLTLKRYLIMVDSLFPQDIIWKTSGKLDENINLLHAIKRDGIKESISNDEIESIFVTPVGLNQFGGAAKVLSDLKGISQFLVRIKLKNGLRQNLNNKIYTVIFRTDKYEYSGSIVNFQNNPGQLILVGLMDNNDFTMLKNKFEDKIIIK
jgi:hypothetical protein